MAKYAKYIEREAAVNLLRDEAGRGATPYHIGLYAAARVVESIPAADVRPVARGRWETVMFDHERMGCRPTAHYCSECHQITWFRTFFCPNCGAIMREES